MTDLLPHTTTQEHKGQHAEIDFGPFTLEVTTTIDPERQADMENLFVESPEHSIGIHTIQRQEPSLEELRVLLGDPRIKKYILHENGKVAGFYLIGILRDIQSIPGNVASTQYYEEIPFLHDFPKGLTGRSEQDRDHCTFRGIPYRMNPPLTEGELLDAIAGDNPLLYLVGQGWFSPDATAQKSTLLEYIRVARLKEDFPTNNGKPSLLFLEVPRGDMIFHPEINGAHIDVPGFPSFQIGQQDYLVIEPIPEGRRKTVTRLLDVIRRVAIERGPNASKAINLRIDRTSGTLHEEQEIRMTPDIMMDIHSEPSKKIQILDELWDAYQLTFHPAEDEECTSIQIQSQSKEELAAVLRDPSSTAFILRDKDRNITGFWITFSDLAGINSRNQDIGGIHSVRLNIEELLPPKEILLYTYTIGSVPDRTTLRPSRSIEKTIFTVLIALMREGASIMGDMSGTTKASGKILGHVTKVPMLSTKVQSQQWYLTVSS